MYLNFPFRLTNGDWARVEGTCFWDATVLQYNKRRPQSSLSKAERALLKLHFLAESKAERKKVRHFAEQIFNTHWENIK